jgi:excisionase family DNA binding protein
MAIEILTADEVGELIRLSANRVVALARRGEIPYLTIDGHVRFDARDVEDWLRYRRSDAPVLPPKLTDVRAAQGDEPTSSGPQWVSAKLREQGAYVMGTTWGQRRTPRTSGDKQK